MGGRPKALLELGGRRIIERVLDAVAPVVDDVLVVTNTPELYAFLRLPMVGDAYPDHGSLGGIFTGLAAASGDAAFTVACDMPFLHPRWRGWWCARAGEGDVVIPRVGEQLETMHARLRQGVPAAHRGAPAGRAGSRSSASSSDVRVVEIAGGRGGAPPRARRRLHERQHARGAGARPRAGRRSSADAVTRLRPVVRRPLPRDQPQARQPAALPAPPGPQSRARDRRPRAGARCASGPGRIVLDLDDHPQPEAVRDRAQRVCGVASVAARLPDVVHARRACRPSIGALVEGRQFGVVPHHRAARLQDLPDDQRGAEPRAGRLRAGARGHARRPRASRGRDPSWRCCPTRRSCRSTAGPGPGGLPVGASGTVAALLSGGIDSPVAAWRMMKRGCRVVFVHFHSVPYLPATSQAKARALVERLTEWQYDSRLYLVPFGEIQREVVLSVPRPGARRRLPAAHGPHRGGDRAGERARWRWPPARASGRWPRRRSRTSRAIDEARRWARAPPAHRHGQDRDHRTRRSGWGRSRSRSSPTPTAARCSCRGIPLTRMSRRRGRARAEARLDIARLVEAGVAGATLETFAFPGSPSPQRFTFPG